MTPEACPVCGHTPTPGWIEVRDGNGRARLARCPCWADRHTAQRLVDAGIPREYRNCTFDELKDFGNEKLRNAIKRAKRFADQFPVVEKGLCMIGTAGIGKTHLAIATLRACILERGATGRYYDLRGLLKTIRGTYNPESKVPELTVLRPAMESDLVVLDDLGAEKPTDWVEETLGLVINERYSNGRLTLITSNYEDTGDTTNMESLMVRVGFRLHSRLHGMCEFLEWEGPDYRKLEPNPTTKDYNQYWQRQRAMLAPRPLLPQPIKPKW